jgi:hypothetical protein
MKMSQQTGQMILLTLFFAAVFAYSIYIGRVELNTAPAQQMINAPVGATYRVRLHFADGGWEECDVSGFTIYGLDLDMDVSVCRGDPIFKNGFE